MARLVPRSQTAFFRFLFVVAERRVWCNSYSRVVLTTIQFLEMLIGADGRKRSINIKVRMAL